MIYHHYLEVRRAMEKAELALGALSTCGTPDQITAAWEAFLIAWVAAVDKLNELASSDASTQGIAKQLSAERSVRGNQALSYCVVCRNMVAHRLDMAVSARRSSTTIENGLITAEGNNSVSIGRLIQGGVEVGRDIELRTEGGRPLTARGLHSKSAVSYNLGELELVEEARDRHNTVKRPPHTGGVSLPPDGFQQLAAYVLAWAHRHLDQVYKAL